MNRRNLAIAGCCFAIVLLAVGYFACSEEEAPRDIHIPIQATHTVRKGEFLRSIAPQYTNVGWEDVFLANMEFLQGEYENVCNGKSSRYRNNPRRRGTFCNDRYKRPYANTLLPGWKLIIPIGKAPAVIADVIDRTKGEKVAIVVDATGSMANDQRIVALYYSAALRKYGRQITGIWMYGDGQVQHLDPEGFVDFRSTGGNLENTYGALKEAAKSNPDLIVLVTDEPGDDWEWPGLLSSMGLPKVIATCLPEGSDYLCEANLKRLVGEVGGEYVRYAPSP
ncbi:LysM peptidoglycan-binding domain-containing protein [Candidatus Uhrbacteria bacterium]|nr:LysM peptidoglycan-binding domain-containing protein [Candidatus Uhrbacteria bacterium]